MKKKEIKLEISETFSSKSEEERKKLLEEIIYKIIVIKGKSIN